jgi:hypothetical protein
MPCGEITLRFAPALGLVLVEEPSGDGRVFDGRIWSAGFPAKSLAPLTRPPLSTFLPPALGLALALFALLRRAPRPGGAGARLVDGEYDDETGKLYVSSEEEPVRWMDATVPGGRVVVVIARAGAELGQSFRESAREERIVAILPGTLRDLGHAERTRGACLALAVAVVSAAPLWATAAWFGVW